MSQVHSDTEQPTGTSKVLTAGSKPAVADSQQAHSKQQTQQAQQKQHEAGSTSASVSDSGRAGADDLEEDWEEESQSTEAAKGFVNIGLVSKAVDNDDAEADASGEILIIEGVGGKSEQEDAAAAAAAATAAAAAAAVTSDAATGVVGPDGLTVGADGTEAAVKEGQGVDDVTPDGVEDLDTTFDFKEDVDSGPDYQDDGDTVLFVDADDLERELGDYGVREEAIWKADAKAVAQAGQQAADQAGTGAAATSDGEGTAAANSGQGLITGAVKDEAGTNAAAAAAAAAAVQQAAAAGDDAGLGPGCGALSRELLDRWAVNNTVLVSLTNSIMFRNFGDTWLHHVRKAGMTYWVLAVADEATAQLVRSKGASHCFLVQENEIDNTNAEFKWGSRSWQLHTWQKVLTVRHVHQLGFNVINSDMDVVWLRNPLEHFLVKYTAPDYWVSMDPITTQNPIGDDGPELGVSTHHYMNTGVYFLRQTPGGKALIDKWYEMRVPMQRSGFHDQDGLYKYLQTNIQEVDREKRITKVVDGQVALAQLPATLFQNGYSHCINQIHKLHSLSPFEVHFVWVWGGNTGKITRMREQRYFIDPPEYYSEPLFLSYDVLPIMDPEGFNSWTDTEAMVQTHLKAVTSQLTDTWYALALAALLNRTLILPKMKCYCIQNWFENPQCRLPGEPHTQFPISPGCPADFIFNMDALATFNLSGRPVPFREFSFLDNERTPSEVKDQPLLVTASPDASSALLSGTALTIPAGLKSDALLAELQPYLQPTARPPKRVHFTNPRQAFGGWSDPRVAEEYQARVSALPVRWCCRPDKVAKDNGVDVGHNLEMKP